MSFPLEVDFHNLERSEFIESAVRERCKKLERFAPHVTRCRVKIAAPHRHHTKGNVYHVSVDLHVPGAEIVVNRDPDKDHAHEDVYVAVRDAINAAARQLQGYVRVRRGDVRKHD